LPTQLRGTVLEFQFSRGVYRQPFSTGPNLRFIKQ